MMRDRPLPCRPTECRRRVAQTERLADPKRLTLLALVLLPKEARVEISELNVFRTDKTVISMVQQCANHVHRPFWLRLMTWRETALASAVPHQSNRGVSPGGEWRVSLAPGHVVLSNLVRRWRLSPARRVRVSGEPPGIEHNVRTRREPRGGLTPGMGAS